MSLLLSVVLGVCLFGVKLGDALHCNGDYCPGANDYCCYDDDYDYEYRCCSGDDLDPWWLWFILVMLLVLLLSCIGCCIRVRRRNRRYLILTGERPIISTTATVYPAYGACATEGPVPVVVTPVYATSAGQQQPPPYTAEAQNKGNPPPYNTPC